MKTFPNVCSKYLEYLLREKSCSHLIYFYFYEIGNVIGGSKLQFTSDTLIPKFDRNIRGNQVKNVLFRLADA